MSEYQYYEFRAVDRPLTEREMAELRALSTRATITATSFQNEYNWGDFRGEPLELMKKYFDAFVYVANWGTRTFMLRVPATLLPAETAQRYSNDYGLRLYVSDENVILEFEIQDAEPEWAEGEGWLDSLLPLRDDIVRGDLRALYIGWLSAVWMYADEGEEAEEEWREPPLPPGLHELSVPLRTLVEFLKIDSDLLEVAAQRSVALQPKPETVGEREEWVRRLPEADKNAFLLRVMQGDGMEVHGKLLQRFLRDTIRPSTPDGGDGRTVMELLTAAEEKREKRKRRQEEQAARERERQAREQAAAREKYLTDLAGRKEIIWARIESLVEMRRAPEYDQATFYITDLHEVAQREGTIPDFAARLAQLRKRHSLKSTFMKRLEEADLG